MFAKVTEGWIHKADHPVQLQQQPVRPQKGTGRVKTSSLVILTQALNFPRAEAVGG